jgi:hypothetical protein
MTNQIINYNANNNVWGYDGLPLKISFRGTGADGSLHQLTNSADPAK